MTTTLFAVGEADLDPLTAMWEPSKSVDFYCLFIVVWRDQLPVSRWVRPISIH